ncbi:MAG: alpha-N-acetylglucosaminidase C-terminal domain-containing protein, partial [Acholeplasmatales bacterium]|nr:alpha-N-acetylglucosaminidase C-terminal domain-containing protein [Acholeplasmatales bacterium]
TGLEYVTRKVFKEFGFSDEELKDWYTGPAFMAWYRMGNVNGWAGPLPDEWIDYEHDLQLKILERMRDYGMTPVLSMFSGYVPSTFTKHFPDANVTMGSNWAGFDIKYRTYTLEVTDPLFNKIAKRFIEIQTETYGTSHIYNGDVYNEMVPRTDDPEYLRQSSKGTFEGLRSADPEAIWLMQGWLFVNEAYFWKEPQVKAYLSGVPDDGMIILDLFTEYSPVWSKFQNYFGKQWIWCTLHNFGGNPGMWGNLTHILQKPQEDIYNSNGTMIGIGITMEAIEQNYVVYEAVLENKWLDGKVNDISKWVENYSSRRYGDDNIPQIKEAWEIMLQNIYYSPYHNVSQIEKVPSFVSNIEIKSESIIDKYKNSGELEGGIENLWKAWGLLLEDGVIDKLKDIDTYNHDIVDLGVNILTNEFDIERKIFTSSYEAKNLNELQKSGNKLLEFIKDADKLLASDKIYLLGRWINKAIKIAPDTKYQKLFEFNARNQITLWGPDGNINDYAAKSWAGLYIDYYYERWKLFIDEVIDAVKTGVEFDYNKYKEEVMNFSKSWQDSDTTYSSDPEGITTSIAKELYNKYKRDNLYVLKGLLERQFPEIIDRFEFIIEESDEAYFEISTTGTDPLETKITIKGNDKLSISSGLGYYLRYHVLSQISWTGDSLKNVKNKKLPPLNEPIRKTSKLKYSYYMNTCTHSYSASWWDWSRWEREIDWMALNGINLPLAFTGLEYVTRKVFKEFGFSDEELKDWYTGPAFMAWYRMGNVNGWAGPL